MAARSYSTDSRVPAEWEYNRCTITPRSPGKPEESRPELDCWERFFEGLQSKQWIYDGLPSLGGDFAPPSAVPGAFHNSLIAPIADIAALAS